MNRNVQQSDLPTSLALTPIADCIERIKRFALQEFDRQIQRHQLYYHTHDHLAQVQRRSQIIFETLCPALHKSAVELSQMERLLDLCVIAHDMVQIFEVQPQHTTRKRTSGISEAATIDCLVDYIHSHPCEPLTDWDQSTIRSAIAATICAYDATEQAIYQPALDQSDLPIVARILALADLGALGMDGIAMYNREGSLLFLEENPDVIPMLLDGAIHQLEITDATLAKNIQQRLLKRCHFQINFAKSRLRRIDRELAKFPVAAIAPLRHQVFQYLTPTTIQTLEATTPTDSPLDELLRFFDFDRYLH
ncbi:hypothetical protein [Phormidesmis priestleyi]